MAGSPGRAFLTEDGIALASTKVLRCRSPTVIGKGTVGAMQSGMFWGYLSMIEGLLTRIQAELSPTGDPPVTVIVTGGLGTQFAEATSMIHHIDNELTLRGLLLVHQRNMAS